MRARAACARARDHRRDLAR